MWPECLTPAAASASLLSGAVTIAWISPAMARRNRALDVLVAGASGGGAHLAARQRGHVDVGEVEHLERALGPAAVGDRVRPRAASAVSRRAPAPRASWRRRRSRPAGEAARTDGSAPARAMISGPTPAGSPMVTPSTGRFTLPPPSGAETKRSGGPNPPALVSRASGSRTAHAEMTERQPGGAERRRGRDDRRRARPTGPTAVSPPVTATQIPALLARSPPPPARPDARWRRRDRPRAARASPAR